MNCPKCEGPTREAVICDDKRDEVYELGWSYCLDPECGWSDMHNQAQEDRGELEAGLL